MVSPPSARALPFSSPRPQQRSFLFKMSLWWCLLFAPPHPCHALHPAMCLGGWSVWTTSVGSLLCGSSLGSAIRELRWHLEEGVREGGWSIYSLGFFLLHFLVLASSVNQRQSFSCQAAHAHLLAPPTPCISIPVIALSPHPFRPRRDYCSQELLAPESAPSPVHHFLYTRPDLYK